MAWNRQRLRELLRHQLGDGLFIIVSNREPYIHRLQDEAVVCQIPSGGLTAALDPVMRCCGGLWVAHGAGDADRQVVDAHARIQVPPEEPSYTLRRVWLSKQEEAGYYYGFSNEALWPLCHLAYTRPIFETSDWEIYKAVNRKFADVILEEIGNRNAFVFIQDYHFALLSRMLKRPNIRTAQFWHIPWPNPEAFRICPQAEEILDGLLGNDLLGFHIPYHCQNFLDTVDRLLESRVDRERLQVTRGRVTTCVRSFPISVDSEAIAEQVADPAVEAEMTRLTRHYSLRQRIIGLGVDRVDYTKGIAERLRAIDRFLERHPEFHKRFVFVEIGVPSRIHIPVYQRLNEEIEQLVNEVNWKYQTDGWSPILHVNTDVPLTTLQAWYRLAHVCVVSSLHDGMNLVAKEYVSSRIQDDGVLVLSHFTGAARELTEALLVNPYNLDELAEAVHQSVIMIPEEQQRRMRKLRAHLKEHNIFHWAAGILSCLLQVELQQV